MRWPGGRSVLAALACLALVTGACMQPGAPRTVDDSVDDRATPPAGNVPEAPRNRAESSSTPSAARASRPAPPLPDAAGAAEPTGAGDDHRPRLDALTDPTAELAPILLRVGLVTDADSLTLPCCGEPLVLSAGGRRWAVRSRLVLRPDPGVAREGMFRLQVAALKDEDQALALAADLQRRSGLPADVHFDAGVDLYRVRVGRFEDRAAADRGRGRLAVLGVPEVWIVGEGGEVRDPAFRLQSATTAAGAVDPDAVRLEGRWLTVEAAEGETVPGLVPGQGRYRGRWLVYLNDRGHLNLINEVTLDDYLRSVVPSEMGPELYRHLEALKAQAVAARTYTLRNLAEFEGEGYDICATPRCQVYKGASAEHPLSDRAVLETHRQVVTWDGGLVDARYSATCGGHTEDVHVVFPLEREPYLRGVPCPEAGPHTLAGGAVRPLATAVLERLLPTTEGGTRRRLELRLRAVARLAGLPADHDRLGSLTGAEARRFTGSLFDLVLDPRRLSPAGDLGALLERAGDAGDPAALDLALLTLAEELGLVERRSAHYRAVRDQRLETRQGDGVASYALVGAPAVFERRGGQPSPAARLDLVPGDPVTLILGGGVVLGVIHEVEPPRDRFRLTSRWDHWTRFKTDEQLVERVAERYPGFRFAGLEVVDRGVSGRVGTVRLLDDAGRAVEVEGLAVRWTLDLPDTRFTARRSAASDGRRGWLFTGSGWGHGVGLCQIGSVNLAGRGSDYRDILRHFYSGVGLARVRALPERWGGRAFEGARARR